MKTIIKSISLLLCTIVVLASCERKPLYDNCICNNRLKIPIDVDWTKCGINPQNVTVLLYDYNSDVLVQEHIYEHNNKDIQSYAELNIGRYKAVIFNELRDQIDYISCKDYNDYKTLKFESNDDTPLRSRSTTTRGYIKQSGDLAVAVVKEIEVTKEMIVEASYTSIDDTKSLSNETRAAIESLMNVVPQKRNNTINITAHFAKLNNARMPALVDLINISDGYFVAEDKNSKAPATLQFTMNNRSYDNELKRNGTISTSLSAFGTFGDRVSINEHPSNSPITLDVLFKLVDKDQTEIEYKMDVTKLLTIKEESNGSVTIDIDVTFTDPLPDVIPEGSDGGSNFGSSVEDWGDIIPVPLS